jgi:hypothetical protein
MKTEPDGSVFLVLKIAAFMDECQDGGSTSSRVRRSLATRGRFWTHCAIGFCPDRIRTILRGLVRQLLLALFFLLFLLCQISLAFLILVIWFGQVISFDRRGGEWGAPGSAEAEPQAFEFSTQACAETG